MEAGTRVSLPGKLEPKKGSPPQLGKPPTAQWKEEIPGFSFLYILVSSQGLPGENWLIPEPGQSSLWAPALLWYRRTVLEREKERIWGQKTQDWHTSQISIPFWWCYSWGKSYRRKNMTESVRLLFLMFTTTSLIRNIFGQATPIHEHCHFQRGCMYYSTRMFISLVKHKLRPHGSSLQGMYSTYFRDSYRKTSSILLKVITMLCVDHNSFWYEGGLFNHFRKEFLNLQYSLLLH